MHEMSRGVIALDIAASSFVHLRQRSCRLERFAEGSDDGVLAVDLLDPLDGQLPAVALDHAGVADLPA